MGTDNEGVALIRIRKENAMKHRKNRSPAASTERARYKLQEAEGVKVIKRSALTRLRRSTANSMERSQPVGQDKAALRLLDDPHLIDRVGEAIRSTGYVGDIRPALLTFVALTSRFRRRPLNVALIGPTAVGKSRAIDAARALVPPAAYVLIRAGTPRALIYFQEPLKHRFVIMAEADSLPEDGVAAAALRSIVYDDDFGYWVPALGSKAGHRTTHRIDIEGPVGLLTTSTRPLSKQYASRVLQLWIQDSPQQTRQIMLSHARRFSGVMPVPPDLSPFVSLHQWLGEHGHRHVEIPFAEALVECLPDSPTRLRRDSLQLLSCISSVAFLHQRQRRRTASGAVEATLHDYEIVRDLLTPVFDAIAGEGLTPQIRETVEAISPKEEVSEVQIRERLALSKATVSERVRHAVEYGWLINEQSRLGRPARLRRGKPLPCEDTSLPTVAQLEHDLRRQRVQPITTRPVIRTRSQIRRKGRTAEH
jgi:hypothetical protein